MTPKTLKYKYHRDQTRVHAAINKITEKLYVRKVKSTFCCIHKREKDRKQMRPSRQQLRKTTADKTTMACVHQKTKVRTLAYQQTLLETNNDASGLRDNAQLPTQLNFKHLAVKP